jgi:hypothetical protein
MIGNVHVFFVALFKIGDPVSFIASPPKDFPDYASG